MRRAPWLLIVLFSACAGGSQFACRKDVITGNEQCQPVSRSPTEAAVGAGAAAASWAVVGCTLNGCPPPDRCNPQTKLCETTSCHSDRDCGAGFHCDASSSHCH